MSPSPDPKRPPRRKSESRYDPTGIDDGQGGIPVGEGRPALRWTVWIALLAVIVGIAALAWRQLERQSIDRHYEDGVSALSAGRMDDARVNFDRVIEKRPEWSAAFRQRGYTSSEPGPAIADFTRAVELDASDADAYAARGRAWVKARQAAKGVDDLNRALALGEQTGVAATTITAWRADRGVARIEAGDAKGALDDLRHAAKARDTPSDHYRLAVALASTGDWAGAREAYDRALATNVQASWLGERALVLMQLGDDTGAGVDLVRCAQMDPGCAETFGVRAGQLARDLGRTPPAGAR